MSWWWGMGPGIHVRVLVKQVCLYLTERKLFKTTTDASNFSLLRVGARGKQQRLCQRTHKSLYCSFLLTEGSRLGWELEFHRLYQVFWAAQDPQRMVLCLADTLPICEDIWLGPSREWRAMSLSVHNQEELAGVGIPHGMEPPTPV